MFENFPYTNFHELNLDWIIQKLKECYSPDNPPENMVLSVNGQTGNVILYTDPEVTFPAVSGQAWEIKRYVDNNHTVGIAFQKNSPAMRLEGTTWYDIYDEGNPPPYPVTSVNGQTGDVSGLYSASNPPPYPVTSVNGQTGAVTGLYSANNPPPYPVSSVNGQTGAVTISVPVQSVNGQTGAVVIPVAFKDNTANYLEATNASTANQWGLEREISSGTAGISFEIENGHIVGYLNYYDNNDQVIDSFKILTPADIPSSTGVVSINGQTGVVTLYADGIAMDSNDATTVKAKIAAMDSTISGHTSSISGINTNLNYIRSDMADTWDATTNYVKGKIVYNGGSLYIATADNAAGTFASQSWSQLVLADEVENKAAESSLAYLENTNTASQNIPEGAYVYWKTGLYKASAAISQYDTLSTSNLTAADSKGALNSLNDQIGTIKDKTGIEAYKYAYDASGNRTQNVTLENGVYLVLIQCYYAEGQCGMYMILKSTSSTLKTNIKEATGVTITTNSTGLSISITNPYTGVNVLKLTNNSPN